MTCKGEACWHCGAEVETVFVKVFDKSPSDDPAPFHDLDYLSFRHVRREQQVCLPCLKRYRDDLVQKLSWVDQTLQNLPKEFDESLTPFIESWKMANGGELANGPYPVCRCGHRATIQTGQYSYFCQECFPLPKYKIVDMGHFISPALQDALSACDEPTVVMRKDAEPC